MIKEAIQYLVSLKDNKTYEINGDTYSDRELTRIAPHIDRPNRIYVNSLDAVVQLVSHELGMVQNAPVFINIKNAREISVFTSWDDTMSRNSLYAAVCDAPAFTPGWMEHDEAIIRLRSMFVPGEDTDLEYVLDLLSRINKESSVSSTDNGVSQTVEARQGVALQQKVRVRPRVSLRPYRTFLEVEQPESEFLLRLDQEGRVGLLEADGGMWVMKAKDSIAAYFAGALADAIGAGLVVVMK